MTAGGRQRVLFLCTGNSCRSQMAEGFARALWPKAIEAFSAGIEKHGLNPHAVRVMAEAGVDISAQTSKIIDDLHGDFDLVVTVCDHAHQSCPHFAAATRVIHRGFDDPPRLARDLEDEGRIVDCYRRVRDQIRDFVGALPQALAAERRTSSGKDAP